MRQWSDHMTNHIQSIQRELKNRDLDAVMITTEVNQRYACGFPFTDGFVLVAREKAWLITDSRYIEAARGSVSSDVEVLLFDNAHPKIGILKGLLHDGLKLAAEDRRLSHAEWLGYERLLNMGFVAAGDLFENLRASKDEEELRSMVSAQRISERALEETLQIIRPGMTEKEVAAELEDTLAHKSEDELTDDERKYLKRKREKKSYTLNVRFTESEMQDILAKCEQYGYKNKTEYIRDCVRVRVDLTPDRSEIAECNRLMKRIGANINQILVRLYSTGHIYAEDITEIKRGVNEIWHTLLSIRSGQQSAQRSLTSQTEIRPSTVYMSTLMLAEPTAQEQARTSEPSEEQAQDEHRSLPTT